MDDTASAYLSLIHISRPLALLTRGHAKKIDPHLLTFSYAVDTETLDEPHFF
jgi:hypothetical protein